jgi:hypothetical protein
MADPLSYILYNKHNLSKMSVTPTLAAPLQRSAPFILFEQTVRLVLSPAKSVQHGHMTMAFGLLASVLNQMYGASDIDRLVEQSDTIGEAVRFAEAASAYVKNIGWAKTTVYPVSSVLKKILSQTAAEPRFVSSLRIRGPRVAQCKILGRKYGSLPLTDPVRSRLDGWIASLHESTKNKSVLSLRNVMSFYLNQCLPRLRLDLQDWPADVPGVIAERVKEPGLVTDICGTGAPRHRKFQWLVILTTHLIPCPGLTLDGKCLGSKKKHHSIAALVDDNDDGEDVHRISTEDLQKIYEEAKKRLPDELMYMTLITTGVRIGGYTRIQTKNVADVKDNQYCIKETGRTLEKGNKWFSYAMSPRVRALVYRWLTEQRPADPSPYLFPSVSVDGVPISTETVRDRFNALCKAAGLVGREFHPHALRHSYAHILLETGNDVQTVSRLLGHASASTTEKFYLKESASQVAERANIPWLTAPKKKRQAVPDFLIPARPVQAGSKKRGLKRRKILATLEMFNHMES